MKLPSDLKILETIYETYHKDYAAFYKDEKTRESKIYVPINCKEIAQTLKTDHDIIFGRLYYHLEKLYGYKHDDGVKVPFFALKVGNDKNCINFPLMASVLAGLQQQHSQFIWATVISLFSFIVSCIALVKSW